jgi:hypothetical protein
MTENDDLLRHYRLNILEFWIGHIIASAMLLLWPAAWDPSSAVALGAYLLVLVLAASLAVVLIEHRRPWPFGPTFEPFRFTSGFAYVSWLAVIFLILIVTSTLNLKGLPINLAVNMGLGLVWLTLTVLWRPLTLRAYPWLSADAAAA